MLYQLICEGACNPNIKDIDAMATRVVRDRSRYDGSHPDDVYVFSHQRLLRYTEHNQDDHTRHRVTCTVCGQTRRYGSGSWWVPSDKPVGDGNYLTGEGTDNTDAFHKRIDGNQNLI